jgi:hypothetical protein
MVQWSAIYAVGIEDMETARSALEKALGAPMEAHESLYMGGDYYLLQLEAAEIHLRHNRDLLEEGELEERVDANLLLYVSESNVDGTVTRKLEERLPLTLIRRKRAPH